MTEPARVGELLPGVPGEVVDRAGHGYDRWAELVAQAGYCHHPIRLAGRVEQADRATGEVRTVYDSEREPDGCCSSRAAPAASPGARRVRPLASAGRRRHGHCHPRSRRNAASTGRHGRTMAEPGAERSGRILASSTLTWPDVVGRDGIEPPTLRFSVAGLGVQQRAGLVTVLVNWHVAKQA